MKEEIWKLHSRCAVRSVGKWVRETRRSEEWSCLRYSDAPGELRRFGAAIRRKQRGRREKLFGREENSFRRRTDCSGIPSALLAMQSSSALKGGYR